MSYELCLARRSVRRFTEVPVPEDVERKLLEAAMAAPSANNVRPWHFVVVRGRETLSALSRVHPFARAFETATLAIVVCGDRSEPKWIEDCAAATMSILLVAAEHGLGSLWVDSRDTHYSGADDEARFREALGVPEDVGVLCAVALGYPAETKPSRTQYDETRVHRERW